MSLSLGKLTRAKSKKIYWTAKRRDHRRLELLLRETRIGHRAHDEQARVHWQRDAGNPARLVARQKNRRPGNVPPGALGAEQRRVAPALAQRLVHARRHHRAVDQPRHDAVDADALPAMVARHRARDADDRGLGGGVRRALVGAKTGDRGDVDDRAAAATDHVGTAYLPVSMMLLTLTAITRSHCSSVTSSTS